MRLPKKFRLFAALYALVSVLFMQLAVAAYACPALSGERTTDASATMEMMDGQTMEGCAKMDKSQPDLCKSHCDSSPQSVSAPHTVPDAPVLPLLAVVAQPDLHRPISRTLDGTLLVDNSSPPPPQRIRVLRI